MSAITKQGTETNDAPWLLKATPRPVQSEAMRRGYKKSGWCHFLEQRLGKTYVALNEFETYRQQHGFLWCVVLAPAHFKADWPVAAEEQGVGVPAHTVVGGTAAGKKRLQKFIKDNHETGGLISVNYEAIRSEPVFDLIRGVCNAKCLIVADESITLKNHQSQTFKRALELSKWCGARRALTGKPTTQGVQDLWAQLRFVGALKGVNFFAFRNKFCKMGGFQGKKIIGAKNIEELQKILDKWSWTARRAEWLKVEGEYSHVRPDYHERPIRMLPEQAAMYEQMQKDFLVELENGEVVSADQVITKLMKMEQISSGFVFTETGEIEHLVPIDKNPKLLAVRDMLQTEIDGKLLVLAQYSPSITALLVALDEWEPAVIRGGMDHDELLDNKRRFNTDGRCRVLVGQLDAIRYGHTLVGHVDGEPRDRCYHTVFYENQYSLNTRAQAEERNQGVAQKQIVSICDFVTTNFDQAKIRALQHKEDISAAVLGYDRRTGILPVLSN